jgi:hypothetical protein
MKDKDRKLIETIEEASEGLEFISETDAPFDLFISDDPVERTDAAIKKFLKLDRKHLQEVLFDDFFDRLTLSHEWHREPDRKRVAKFKKLRTALEKKLDGLRVYRSGRLHIDIFIVGHLPDGRAAGVRTKALET